MDTSSLYKLHMERDRPKKAGLIKVRFIIAVLATLCPVVCYISRQNLPFAIVSMVEDADSSNSIAINNTRNPTSGGQLGGDNDNVLAHLRLPDSGHSELDVGRQEPAGSHSPKSGPADVRPDGVQPSQSARDRPQVDPDDGTCPAPATQNEADKATSKGYGAKYQWSAEDKGILLGAFFYTYVLCQIPGARLAERIGAKWILVTASFGSALFSFVSPWAASQHVYFFSAIRLLMGVCQAALYPTCYVLYSKWLPPVERSQALPILCVGAYVGSIIASSLTGYFSEQPSLGWEYAFYVPGVMCSIWTLLWIIYATNEPRDHHSISLEELVYIESRMEQQKRAAASQACCAPGLRAGQVAPSKPQISWTKLFTSQSIWAMMAGFFASNWSFTIVLLLIPTYLNRILNVSPLNNGIINSIIYILYCIASPLVGAASTMMIETRPCGISRLNVRKFFQGTALIGQALCFIALPLMGCNQNFVFGVLFIQIVFFSFVNGGEVQLPTELSVDFAGTIYAIGNCVGSSTGFIVPLVHSQIVHNELSRGQWEMYFYLAALISTLGGLIFILFGQNELQDFSKSLADSQANIFKRKPGLGGDLSINMELDIGSYRRTSNDTGNRNSDHNTYTGRPRIASAS